MWAPIYAQNTLTAKKVSFGFPRGRKDFFAFQFVVRSAQDKTIFGTVVKNPRVWKYIEMWTFVFFLKSASLQDVSIWFYRSFEMMMAG